MTSSRSRWQQHATRVTDAASYAAFAKKSEHAKALLQALWQRLGVPSHWTHPPRGSSLVALTENEVLKVMPPHEFEHAAVEAACLTQLDGALPLATPRLLDTGTFEGWHYLRMTRLPGQELTELWPTLPVTAHVEFATQLGETLRALHALEAPQAIPRVRWTEWVAEQRAGIVATQRAKGCPEALLEQLPNFLATAPLVEQRTAWLHTEVMREHLLVAEVDGAWRLSGLFDFEPSWVAPIDYEFASVGLFFSAADPRVLGNVLRAAGVAPSPTRLLAMTAMHRYVNLAWYLERLGGPLQLDDLAHAWFGWD